MTFGGKAGRKVLHATRAAKTFLAELIEAKGFSKEIAIRSFHGNRGLVMAADCGHSSDMALPHERRTVLLPDEEVSSLLADSCLVVDELELNLRETDEET